MSMATSCKEILTIIMKKIVKKIMMKNIVVAENEESRESEGNEASTVSKGLPDQQGQRDQVQLGPPVRQGPLVHLMVQQDQLVLPVLPVRRGQLVLLGPPARQDLLDL
jgi:hypothetical protein